MVLRAIPVGFFTCSLALAIPNAWAGGKPVDSGEQQQPGSSAWAPRYPSTPLPTVGKGTFKVTQSGKAAPFGLDKLEQMTISVKDKTGAPVNGANFEITARARDIVRLMQTTPQVTRQIGKGQYLVEGLSFTAAGSWLLEFGISAGGREDKALLEVQAR